MERLRWPLVGVTALLLGVSFYYAYVRRPSGRSKIIAWVAAGIAVAATVHGILT